jgi:hypothetical protein
MPDDDYKPGDALKSSKRTLHLVWAFGVVLLAFIAYAGSILGWWP